MPTYDIADRGADKTGSTAIDSVLDPLVGSNTTIVFPSGTYKLNDLIVPSGTNDLKLIAPNGARLVPGRSGDNVRWMSVSSRGFVLDGFELDMRNTAIPPYIQMNSNSGNWELRRLITRGKVRSATDTNVGTNNSSDARTYFRLSSADGTRGLLQDCYFNEGACAPSESSNRRAILIESSNGDIVLNRCWFELWAENTIYAKKPEGALKIYNCYLRNTQNGMRLGGNTEVNNTVSIKDGQHPRQAWTGGSLQRGVNVEATVPTNASEGIDSYNGTLEIVDSDFNHRYLDPSCGSPLGAGVPCERISVRNTRMSFDSTKQNQDAIYTLDGKMDNGSPVNLAYLQLQNVEVRNDHENEYGISIGQTPDSWGTVSGTIGGSGLQTNSSYVSSRMTVNGNPTAPNTTPPLPNPPALGKIPLQSAQLVRIDNTGNSSSSTFSIQAGSFVGPAGNDGATVYTNWASSVSAKRVPNSTQASGTVPAGEAYAFYVTGGIVSTSSSGPAVWTVDGEPYTPGTPLATKTLSTDQPNRDTWTEAQTGVSQNRVVVTKPLSYNGTDPCHTRLRNVGSGNFEYKLEEWAYLDGSYSTETAHMLAVQPTEQRLRLSDGSIWLVKAGTKSTNSSFTTVSLGSFFDAQPVVLTKSQTINETDPIATRVQNVTQGSFDVRIQEEEAGGTHGSETVGYIALQPTTGRLNGKAFEVQRTSRVVTDSWYRIDFQQQYDSPKFITDIQTYYGTDPANLRYRNLTGTGVDIKVEEEQSRDTETAHTSETVGYTVFEGSQ
jgi:hypothetical protein